MIKSDINILGLVADLVGVLSFLFFIKSQIDGAIENLKLPKQLDFYFLFFWAVVAAFVGGMIWNGLNRLNEEYHFMEFSSYVGGRGSEPHGRGAIIWPLATTIPVMITLIILNWKYHFIGVREQIILYIAFLVGITIGSVLFYDFLPLSGNPGPRNYFSALFHNHPIPGKPGFRNHFEASNVPFFQKEFWLVVIWSSLLSALGFLSIGLLRTNAIFAPRDFWSILWTYLKQTGLCIGLTSLAVVFFLLVFPSESKFDTARGIIAGMFLRVAVFFGLLFI